MSELTALQLSPSQRQNLGESIAEVLREAIFTQAFNAGQRLTEVAIANNLKVSRAPVREALALLEQEGVVRRTNNKGAVVPVLTEKDAEEICIFRGTLEVLAVRLAVPRATDAQLMQLADSIRAQTKARTAEELTLLDLQFHEIIVRAADHSRLLTAWLNLRSQIRLLLMQRNLTDPSNIPWTPRSHQILFEAIRDRDEARAVGLAEEWAAEQRAWCIKRFQSEEASDRVAERRGERDD
jgi:DNA-binding GntR family transcriptional regulator